MRAVLTALVAATAFTQSPFTDGVIVEKVAGGFQFTEGPCWRKDGVLLFSDVSGDTVYGWTTQGGAQAHYSPSGNSNGLALDTQGRLLLAQHGKRRLARLEADGTETALATHYGGKRLNSPNDLAVKSDGSIYLTDPPYGVSSIEEELGFYGVYRVTSDPQAPELLTRDLKRPNGIAFSPDESRLYVADTNDARVVVFDVKTDGTLANQRVLVQKQGELAPDGIKVDAAGNLYITGTEGTVWIYSPAGDLLGSFAVPEKTRNLAWGDADGKSLYITSGSSVYRVRATPGVTKYPEMSPIPGGEFKMGDHHNFVDPGHPSDEVPIHKVWIDALYVGTYDVTTRQYVDYLNSAYSQGLIEVRNGMVYRKGSDDAYCETRQMVDYSSIGWDGTAFTVVDFRANHPVVGVRWNGAAAYTNWLSQQQGYPPCYDFVTWKCDFTKNGYRLPTEAEWEYVARGGRYSPYRNFPWGDDADYSKANWPDSNDPFEAGALPWTTPVGFYDGLLKRKANFNWPGTLENYQTADGANGFGLYDMSGNIWQWCNDWYSRDYYSVSPYKNPPGPDTGSPMPDGQPYRVLRGGNWFNGDRNDPGHGRVSNRDPAYFRGPQDPNHPYYHVGFRVVRSAPLFATVSAANYEAVAAPESIVAGFSEGLAPALAAAGSLPLPTSLLGTTVKVTDAAGTERLAPLFFVSPGQINYLVPTGTTDGLASVTTYRDGQAVAVGNIGVQRVAPALFAANADGKGVAAAVALKVAADGTNRWGLVFDATLPEGQRKAVPIDLGEAADQLYLLLFGTGMRGFTQTATATVGGIPVEVAGPVPQDQFVGLDQVNLGPLSRSLAGRGVVDVLLSLDGKMANRVTVSIK